MRDQKTSATYSDRPVSATHSGHVTLPAGWGKDFPGGREGAVHVRTSGHRSEDDRMGIYRHDSGATDGRRDATAPADPPAAHASTEHSAPEPVKEPVRRAPTRPRGLGLRGHEVIAGAGASALATVVTSALGIGGTAFGSAMTSIVIAIAGAAFARLLTRDRGSGGSNATVRRTGEPVPAAHRGRGGVFLRTVGVALVVTLGTGLIGAAILAKEMGGSVTQQLINVTSSGYRLREMWEQAWPYLREAWRAAVR